MLQGVQVFRPIHRISTPKINHDVNILMLVNHVTIDNYKSFLYLGFGE